MGDAVTYMVLCSTRSRLRSLLSCATMCGPVIRAGISPPFGMPFFGFRFPFVAELVGVGDAPGLEKVENGVDAAEPPLSEPGPRPARIGEPVFGGLGPAMGLQVGLSM